MDVPAILSVTTLFFISLTANAIIIGIALQILELLEMPYYGSRWIFIWSFIIVTTIFVLLHNAIYSQLYIFWLSPFERIANWVGSLFGNPQLSCLSLIAIMVGIALVLGGIWFVLMRLSNRYYHTPQWFDNVSEYFDNLGKYYTRLQQTDPDDTQPKEKKEKNKPASSDGNYIKQKVSLLDGQTNQKVKVTDDGELSEAQPFQITIYGKGDQVSDSFYLEEGVYRVKCKKKGDTGWISVSVVSLDDKEREEIELEFFSSGSELLDIPESGRYVFKIQGVFYDLQWGVRVEKL